MPPKKKLSGAGNGMSMSKSKSKYTTSRNQVLPEPSAPKSGISSAPRSRGTLAIKVTQKPSGQQVDRELTKVANNVINKLKNDQTFLNRQILRIQRGDVPGRKDASSERVKAEHLELIRGIVSKKLETYLNTPSSNNKKILRESVDDVQRRF